MYIMQGIYSYLYNNYVIEMIINVVHIYGLFFCEVIV